MESTTIKILNEDGAALDHKILFTFECEELGKNYIAYEGNVVGQDDEQTVCVASYNPNADLSSLEPVIDSEELKMVNTVLNQIIETFNTNERYTYGYETDWNIENRYIQFLDDIMDEYNAQIYKINKITSSKNLIGADVQKTFNITPPTEEQFRKWYEEDYSSNKSLISFEKYKEDIDKAIFEKHRSLGRKELPQNKDEYFANLYYLIDIKNEIRKNLNQRKNELKLWLSERNIELSSILLAQSKLKIEYDKNGNIVNFEDLQVLRQKYDDIWIEIRRIEHTLQNIEEIFKVVDFTQEENELIMRGLNSQQRKIYDKIAKDLIDLIVPENNNDDEITLDSITCKVCGDKLFNDSKSGRYTASKIKTFSQFPEKKFQKSCEIISIPTKIVGIIPKSPSKFIDKDPNQMFIDGEDRANNLSDKEVEINERIKNDLNKIEYCEIVITTLKEKLHTERSLEMIGMINEVLDVAYSSAYQSIKDLIALQSDVNNLQKNNMLHSFERKLKDLDSKISSYNKKIEYSLDPKQVVDSYILREQVYNEKANEKNREETLIKNHLNVDLQSLSLIKKNLVTPNFVFDASDLKIKTFDFNFENEFMSKDQRKQEIKEIIESLKSIKNELTEEEQQEIEEFFSKGRY